MPDPLERFIAAAVAPFGDNAELRIAASHHFAEAISAQVLETRRCDSLEKCAARLEAIPGKRPALRRFLLPALLLLSLLPAGLTASHFFRHRQEVELLTGKDILSGGFSAPGPELIAPDASSAEKLLLFGDLSKSDPVARIKALWDSDPENPAYFAEYARIHIKGSRALPPDFLATAARLDPGNGYFSFLAAGLEARACVERVFPKTRAKAGDPPRAPMWVIKDQARLDEAMDLLKKSSALPEWRSYEDVLQRARSKILGGPSDTLERTMLSVYFSGRTTFPTPTIDLGEAVAAKASQCAEQSDKASYSAIERAAAVLSGRLARMESPGMISFMVYQSTISEMTTNLSAAAEALEMPDTGRLKSLHEKLTALREQRKATPETSARGDWIDSHGSWFIGHSVVAEGLRNPGEPMPTAEVLKPGRLADYALADRAGALFAWAVFGIAALAVWLFRFRGGTLARRLSPRVLDLLRIEDWLWVIGAGILLPFTGMQIIAWLTPLGCREWSVTVHGLVIPTGQLLATLVLMLGLPPILADWRLRLRSGKMIPAPRRPWTGLLLMTTAALALPLFAIALWLSLPDGLLGENKELLPRFADLDITQAKGSPRILLFTATSFIALGLCWGLGLGARALLGSGTRMLRRVVLSRMLFPAYAIAILLAALALPLDHAVEKHWIAHDELMRITTDPTMTEYEKDAVRDYRQRLVKILDTWN